MRALIEDTNQKVGKHIAKNTTWAEKGVHVVRNKLPYGDYISAPTVVVDTKTGIEEIAYDIGSDHVRFKRSCVKAQECGSRFVMLIETEQASCVDDVERWVNPRLGEWEFASRHNMKSAKHPPIDGKRLAKAMRTMNERYGVEWQFCAPNEAGQAVIDILEGRR